MKQPPGPWFNMKMSSYQYRKSHCGDKTVFLSLYTYFCSTYHTGIYAAYHLNSLAPGRPGCHFKTAIFNLVLSIGIFTSSKDNILRWMPRDLTDDKSTLVQVMAWCRQATSHYLSQCWPSSMSPYGITRPQWVNCVLFELSSILSYQECPLLIS